LDSKCTSVFTFSTIKTCCAQSSLALAFTDMPNGCVVFVALTSKGGGKGGGGESGGEGGGGEGGGKGGGEGGGGDGGGEGGGGEGGGGEGGGVGGGDGEWLHTHVNEVPQSPASSSLSVLVHVQFAVLASSTMQSPKGKLLEL
jgi:hypothetical protein